jgi:hypothetical protein
MAYQELAQVEAAWLAAIAAGDSAAQRQAFDLMMKIVEGLEVCTRN